MRRLCRVAAVVILAASPFVDRDGSAHQKAAASSPAWPQWGGPRRDFTVDASGLAATWPPAGPKQLWSRPLGNGHSGIAADAGRLFTMYRPPASGRGDDLCSEEEVVVALDAATGRTAWEHRYPSPNADRIFTSESHCGPHATPLIVGERVFTVSTNKIFMALDKQSGKLLWSHDFVKDFGTTPRNPLFISVQHGFAPSPIAYKDTVITMAGGPGQGVMAFRQDDGRVVWRTGTFTDIANASPILINVQGQEQLVVLSADGAHGFDPATGAAEWNVTLNTWHGANNSTPVWSEKDGVLCITSAYEGFREALGGTHAIALTRKDGLTEPKELWWNTRTAAHFGNMVRADSYYIVSDGDYGPAFLTALDAETGKELWRTRGLGKASFLLVNGKQLLILEEDGDLVLATPSREKLTIEARAPVLKKVARTAPTLVGTTVYVRDHATIHAFDLGKSTSSH